MAAACAIKQARQVAEHGDVPAFWEFSGRRNGYMVRLMEPEYIAKAIQGAAALVAIFGGVHLVLSWAFGHKPESEWQAYDNAVMRRRRPDGRFEYRPMSDAEAAEEYDSRIW